MLRVLGMLGAVGCAGTEYIVVHIPDGRADLDAVVHEINERMGCSAVRLGDGIQVEVVERCADYYPVRMCYGAYLPEANKIVLQRFTGNHREYVTSTIFIHEIGHAFGLDHVDDAHQIMVSGLTDDLSSTPRLTDAQWDVYTTALRAAGACETR
jgi:hypothetical protein